MKFCVWIRIEENTMDDWMDLPLSASQLGASLCSANNPEQDVYTLEVGLLGEGAGGRVLPCVAKYSFSPSPMIVIICVTKYHCWPIKNIYYHL